LNGAGSKSSAAIPSTIDRVVCENSRSVPLYDLGLANRVFGLRYKLPLVIDVSVFQLLLLAIIGWLDRREREALGYLIEENRLLRWQIGGRRRRLTDDDGGDSPYARIG
jgi:hypothetical protein